MKKVLSIIIMAAMMVCMLSVCAFAAADSASAMEVYVTIVDGNGKLAMAHDAITVTDKDGDGTITVNDVLICAHDAEYDGGAAAGYSSVEGTWGLNIEKLWGVANGGSYGYYVDNNMAMSLGDTVKDGSSVNAFIYTDVATYADTYCFFDSESVSVKAGESISLTLSKYSWNAATNTNDKVAVSDAVITLNGVDTQYKTDAEGKVTVTLDEGGEFIISARSDSAVLVPPVCVASVEKAEEPNGGSTTSTPEGTVTEENSTTAEVTEEKSGCGSVIGFSSIAIIALGATCVIRNRKDEE